MLYHEFFDYLMSFIYKNYNKKIKTALRFTEEKSDEAVRNLCINCLGLLVQNIKDEKYEPRANAKMSTYLTVICKNLVRDYLRHKRIFIEEMEGANLDSLANELNIPRYDESQIAMLRKAMIELREERPICFKLLSLWANDKKMAEIAILLKFSGEDSAKSQKFKCVQSLKSIYFKLNGEN